MLKTFLIFLSLFLTVSIGHAGDIIGVIRIDLKTPDPQAPISPFAHSRGEMQSRALMPEALQSLVYLSDSPLLPASIPPLKHPVMDQRNLVIIPHILPVIIGTTVDFPNSDALYHNLFSLSPARKFDLGRYPKGSSKSVAFKNIGEVHIFCDIHPTMSAVVLVLPNHFYSMTDSNGNFRINDIPAGTYTINAWHEQLKDVSQTVIVPENGIVDIILNLQD